MRLRSILAFAALASACLIARADTFTVFDVNSTFNGGVDYPLATISGTITLDTSTNEFSSVDLTATNFGGDGSYNLDVITSQLTTADDTQKIVIKDPSGLLVLDLYLPVDTLNGYTGGDICSHGTSGCDTEVTTYEIIYGADTGSLDPVPTPEPSSLLLLGTGLIGVAGALRRRLV